MPDMRWQEEGAEIIDLIYRIQGDYGGSIPEAEAQESFGPWVKDAAKRAEQISWLVAKGAPPVLKVTYGGRKALEAALAVRNSTAPQPHWFGGSIIPVEVEYNSPVIAPLSYKPYTELKEWALKQGVLSQEDVDRAARSKKRDSEDRVRVEELFPGTRWFAASLRYAEEHPLAGGFLDPEGQEGPYQVTVTLTRRGAPNIPSVYVTDPYSMEGDSHLVLREKRSEDGTLEVPSLLYTSLEGETTEFQLRANGQGRLGQISTVLRAENAADARNTAYRLFNPFLCALSYSYDVPIEDLQWNIVELATLTVGGMKQDDFPEKVLDTDEFMESGIDYRGEQPNYEFFTRLYREGVNSPSLDYGFLCFYRIAEGIILLRRKRVAEQQGIFWRKVSRPDVFLDSEVAEGDEAERRFPAVFLGESLWKAYESLEEDRVKVGHAFLDEEDPVSSHEDIITDRLEGEEHAATRRAQARYIARRMLKSEFWLSSETE